MGRLTVLKIKTLTKPGLHGDGDTLFLHVAPGGSKSWVQRVTIKGVRRNLGLGGWPVVSLEKARRRAFENRVAITDGRDPFREKQDAKQTQAKPTFKAAAEAFYEENVPRWKNSPNTKKWMQNIRKYAIPAFGKRPVDTLTRQDMLRVLIPLWKDEA